MQDYYAILVQPTSQANAEAGSNNNEPMTPLRTKQAIDNYFLTENVGIGLDTPTAKLHVDGEGRFDLVGNEFVRFKGVQDFLLTIGDSGGIPAIITNGYICINGNSITDPMSHTIAGHNTYMFGIWTDIASEPIMVVKGSSGDFHRYYNGSDVLVFSMDQYGGAQFGADNMSVVNFGKNIASTSELKVTNGRLESRYGGETHPRYLVHNNGYLTFSLDGTADPSVNGARFGISAAGTAYIATSDGSALRNRIIANASGEVQFGYFGPTSVTIGQTRRANFGDLCLGKNLAGVNGSDDYRTPHTGSYGYSAIEHRFGGDVAVYGSDAATTADAVVTPPMRLIVKGDTGRVGINEAAPDYLLDVNGAIGFAPGASVTPVDNGDVVFELTNNTTLTIKAKGSDGTVRSGTVTLS